MTRLRSLAAALALCAAAVAGCGLGPGKDEGEVSLTVTRDYGGEVMVQKSDSIHESDTVIRLLDRNADITTRYGGGFIQSIDGLSGGSSGGRRSDWFFYVNGIESPIGSAEYNPSGGDRIWWDYRDWTGAMRVPAVVGSWPEPFAHGFEGRHWATHPVCLIGGGICDAVIRRLQAAGIRSPGFGPRSITLLIGPWNAIRGESPADLLADGPDRSGVFARFVNSASRPFLEVLNQRGQPAGSIGRGAGLIAALRPGDGPPTWVVTGTDAKGVAAAAGLLGEPLRNHYALATQPGALCDGARQRNPCGFGVPVP